MILSNNNPLKKIVRYLVVNLSPTLYFTQLYVRNRHRWPNFNHPKDLSEIVMSEIINGKINDYVHYVDKVKVRKYIEEWGLGKYLPKLYKVWEKAEDIDFDVLPNKFALKTNHGCGGHLFCHDKSQFDKEYARKHMAKLLKQSYGGRQEPHYRLIKPLIYAEELLEEPGVKQPFDYKFMCCDHEIKFILFTSERGVANTGVKLSTYSLDWKKLDYVKGPEASTKDYPCPPQTELQEMINIAHTIAQKFEHVRVDLYDIKGKIYIGELTFTPEGGIMDYFNNIGIDAAGHKKDNKSSN